jgi:hypothetical protein
MDAGQNQSFWGSMNMGLTLIIVGILTIHHLFPVSDHPSASLFVQGHARFTGHDQRLIAVDM